jgi:hypothetical protein
MSGDARARRLADRLGPRDLAILASLQELRILSGNQLGRLHVTGEHSVTHTRKTRATLQRLAELGAMVRLRRRVGGVRAGSQGFVYALSGLGQAVLDLGHQTRHRRQRTADTKPAFQTHTLAVSEIVVRLVERCRTGQADLLDAAAEPRCWRRFPGMGGQTVTCKPDAFVRLGVGGYEISAFVEMDLDTESTATIARKLAVYVAYWRSGLEQRQHGVFPMTWWLVPDTARGQAIARTIGRLPPEAQALFTVCLASQFIDLLTQHPTEGGAQ